MKIPEQTQNEVEEFASSHNIPDIITSIGT